MVRQGGRSLSDRYVTKLDFHTASAQVFPAALRKYRRRGRKKAMLHGKQCGGNEWISDYIFQTTGEERDRKQVSSHIQVLKNFLHDNLPC